MTDDTARRARQRPTVVSVAVAMWWLLLAVQVVMVVVGIVQLDREDPELLPAGIVGAVLGVALSGFLGWVALRMGRGSGPARFWLALLAGLGLVSAAITAVDQSLSWRSAPAVLAAVAAVLTYLPTARPWFPRVEPRARRVEPRTVGWDPQTGERITEQHEADGRG